MNYHSVVGAVLLALVWGQPPARGEEKAVRLPRAEPAEVGMDAGRLARLDGVVQEALRRRQLPGAVILVVRQGRVVFHRAYGQRSLKPGELAMTEDTVFDLASLTKPIATATAILLLLERGQVRLGDHIAEHLPAFRRKETAAITIEHLLLHTSGLIGDNPLSDYQDGREKALERINRLTPLADPGQKFMYSDVGYIVLGELVEKVAGEPLDVFTRKHIFLPLGMKDTTFRPSKQLAERAAPTELRAGSWLRGEVHDPRAHLLGGVAGDAGLFSTGEDLAVYAQMILGGGACAGRRVLSPAAVRLMTTPRPVPGGLRALGWDVQTAYSSNRGELFPAGSFGHTGFTGTSLWIDPGSQTAVVFLSNRVHPDGKGDVKRLRGQVATLVAASIVTPPLAGEAREAAPFKKQ